MKNEEKKKTKINDETLSKISGGRYPEYVGGKYQFRKHQLYYFYDPQQQPIVEQYSVDENKNATINDKIFCYVAYFHGENILERTYKEVDVSFLLTCRPQ